MKELLVAGVQFGHNTKRLHPKMTEYVFNERNAISMIDLHKTHKMFGAAANFVRDSAAQGKTILFVGTKPPARDAVADEAARCQMFFVNHRWLSGLLTNRAVVQESVQRLKELEAMASVKGGYAGKTTEKIIQLKRERNLLNKNLAGIKDMPRTPDVLFVVDSTKEALAVKEARQLGIPVVALLNTNCDPDEVDWMIPANDESMIAIRLLASKIADAVIAGRALATE